MKIVNFGSMNLDHVYTVAHFVVGGETLLADGLTDCIGGKGLNQSLAVARSGAEIFHAGMLGEGGEMLRDCLKESGVGTSLLKPCARPQGHTVIQVNPNGQNCIIVYGGSNRAVSREYIDEVLAQFEPGDYLMLQNEISNLQYLVDAAAARGLKIVLNASPVNEELLKVDFSKLEWLVVNEIECAAVAGCEDVKQAYETLKGRYPKTGILLTLGENGSVSWKDGEEVSQPAYRAKAIDTTGAGDTFVGYFIGCLYLGYSRAEAMRHASMASSIAVGRMGAAPSIPVMKEVEQALERV